MKDSILFASPGYYRGVDEPHMRRDAFRFVEYRRKLGFDTRLLLLSAPGCESLPRDFRLAAAPLEKWLDPCFWLETDAKTLFVYAYGCIKPKTMSGVFDAVRKAGLKLVFQTDSGLGLPAFPYRPWTIFKRRYWWNRAGFGPTVASVRAAMQTANWMVGGSTRFMCRNVLSKCDRIRVESSLSLRTTRDRLSSLGLDAVAERVEFAPHPVPDSFLWKGTKTGKNRRIVAVAMDWTRPGKGGELLGRAFARALPGSGWTAVVVGGGSARVKLAAEGASDLVEAIPLLAPNELPSVYSGSEICVMASGAETGPICAWEALLAGCSLVFPPELVQLESLSEAGVATMSDARNSRSLMIALRREMQLWDSGKRDPGSNSAAGAPALVSTLSANLDRPVSEGVWLR